MFPHKFDRKGVVPPQLNACCWLARLCLGLLAPWLNLQELTWIKGLAPGRAASRCVLEPLPFALQSQVWFFYLHLFPLFVESPQSPGLGMGEFCLEEDLSPPNVVLDPGVPPPCRSHRLPG